MSNRTIVLFILLGHLISPEPAGAQLNRVFQKLFDQLLREELVINSARGHGNHFFAAADNANSRLVPALNSLVANTFSSFPLSSTSPGVRFDWSTGQPVSIKKSLGPIFAETATTLEKGKIHVGVNYTSIKPTKFRGFPLSDMSFTFSHQDVMGSGVLGDRIDESDVIDLILDLDINAHLMAIFATMGITEKLDIGFAIPIIHIEMSGDARALISSHTLEQKGESDHSFRGSALQDTLSYSGSAAGVGDAVLRLKYNLVRRSAIDMAILLDLTLFPGDQDDFMSSGHTGFRLSTLFSRKIKGFTPHLNLGYRRRPAPLDSDKFEFVVGFDQKLTSGVTLAAELLGRFDLDKNEAIKFDGMLEIVDHDTTGEKVGSRSLPISNIPEADYDNILNASFGLRIAPSDRFSFLANVLVALNDGGLRSDVVPTFGLGITF